MKKINIDRPFWAIKLARDNYMATWFFEGLDGVPYASAHLLPATLSAIKDHMEVELE